MKMKIYEPAMCCSTGLCGVGVDPELLRISTVINNLGKSGVIVDRYNLSNAPQAFINNKEVNEFINKNGVNGLPVTVLGDKIVIAGRYPTNEEISSLLGLPMTIFNVNVSKNSNSCCGGSGCC